jgi:hypothetical protein
MCHSSRCPPLDCSFRRGSAHAGSQPRGALPAYLQVDSVNSAAQWHWYAVNAAEQSAMTPALTIDMQPDCSALASVPQHDDS